MKYGFFIFIFIFLLTMIVYTIIRGTQALSIIGNWKWVYLSGMILLFVAFIFGMFFANSVSPVFGKIISFIGFSFLIIFVYFFISFLIVDIIRSINHFIPFITNVPKFRYIVFLTTMLTTFAAMGIGNYKFNHPKTVRINIQSNKPVQGKQIKIVAVSDIHLSVYIDKNKLQKYVQIINAEHPDLVLIAGDLIDRSLKPVIRQKMDEELQQIKAPMGVYAIFGNHEYFSEDVKAAAEFYKKSNINLLNDSIALINNQFYIAGRDDKMNSNRKELVEILRNSDKTKPVILIDHQPYNLNDAEKNNVDFQFSGHTHNGQFFPGNLFVKGIFELPYGYLKKGLTHFYVSSGLGIWGPEYRIASQSEMVVVDFKY